MRINYTIKRCKLILMSTLFIIKFQSVRSTLFLVTQPHEIQIKRQYQKDGRLKCFFSSKNKISYNKTIHCRCLFSDSYFE